MTAFFFFLGFAVEVAEASFPFRVAGVLRLSGFCYGFFILGITPDLRELLVYLPLLVY